jgi:hypothetical protein
MRKSFAPERSVVIDENFDLQNPGKKESIPIEGIIDKEGKMMFHNHSNCIGPMEEMRLMLSQCRYLNLIPTVDITHSSEDKRGGGSVWTGRAASTHVERKSFLRDYQPAEPIFPLKKYEEIYRRAFQTAQSLYLNNQDKEDVQPQPEEMAVIENDQIQPEERAVIENDQVQSEEQVLIEIDQGQPEEKAKISAPHLIDNDQVHPIKKARVSYEGASTTHKKEKVYLVV